jgi:AraC-like DNA-binding protein
VEEHLEASLTLGQMAAVARLSVYHFARQFKAATELPPHQYVILRRVERAKQLLHGDLSLAEVAACAGFSAQSQFSDHFKRLVGVAPRQFQMPARIAQKVASSVKKRESNPGTIPHEQAGSAWSRRWRGPMERPAQIAGAVVGHLPRHAPRAQRPVLLQLRREAFARFLVTGTDSENRDDPTVSVRQPINHERY